MKPKVAPNDDDLDPSIEAEIDDGMKECMQFANELKELRSLDEEAFGRVISRLKIAANGADPEDTNLATMAQAVLEELDIDSSAPLTQDEEHQVLKRSKEGLVAGQFINHLRKTSFVDAEVAAARAQISYLTN